jgi:hypothetical protein
MIWYVPGVLFGWTGLFEYHEFGANPAGWAGHAVMFAFYVCVAALASWPFGPRRAAPGPAEPPESGRHGDTRG